MSCLRDIEYIFNDQSPLGLMKQDILTMYISNEKVRKGAFAQVGALKKQIIALRKELEEIKQVIGMKNEKISDLSDLPILEFIGNR